MSYVDFKHMARAVQGVAESVVLNEYADVRVEMCQKMVTEKSTDVDFHKPLIPLHWTFHPWSSKKAPENVWRNVQSFLFTQPRGVLSVWCLAGCRQFTLCDTSLVSLFQSLLLQGGSGTPCLLSPHNCTEGGSLCKSDEKSRFQWRTCEHPICQFFTS